VNLDDTVKNETLMLTFKHVHLLTVFSFLVTRNAHLTLASCQRKLLSKILH